MARQSRSPLRFRITAITSRSVNFARLTATVETELVGLTRAEAYRAKGILREYPAQNPNSRYQRTNTLRNSWHVKTIKGGDSLGYTLSNDANESMHSTGQQRDRLYARYVHGPGLQPVGFQSNIEAGLGWPRIEDVVDRNSIRNGVRRIIRRGLRNAI